MRWLFALALAGCAEGPQLDAQVLVEDRGTITAMATDGEAVYFATSGHLSVNLLWYMPADQPGIYGSSVSYVTGMAVVDGELYTSGEGGTRIVGAGEHVLVTRSEGTRIDVLEPRIETVRAHYEVGAETAVAVAAGRVAIEGTTYTLDGGDAIEHMLARRARVVLPTVRGLAWVDEDGRLGESAGATTRVIGDVGVARTLVERGDELWAFGADWVARARDGEIERFDEQPITAVAASATTIYFATGSTLWRVR